MRDDAELLRCYAENRADDAFAELVRRHVNLVYSCALRQVNGDAHLAQDVTQLVFTDLARKSAALAGHRVLAGWLFTSTRFAAAKVVRGERRRQAREQEAQLMQEPFHDDAAAQLDWARVRPVLDDVLGELSEADREAVLLRFFQGRDFADVGAKLNLSENTARMRVERALDKLRGLLERRGVASTTAVLAAALTNQAVLAAPAGLAASVTGAALAGAASGGLAAAAATFMTMTKLQVGIASALAVAGATGFAVQARTNTELRTELASPHRQSEEIAMLQAENLRLAKAAVEVEELRKDDAALAQLGDRVAGLKGQLQQAERLAAQADASEKAERAQVYDIAKLDQAPRLKSQVGPVYPIEMREAGITGEVVVDFITDTQGQVKNAQVVHSSRKEFEASALQAVSAWRFDPGQKGGRAVNTHLQVPIVFSLSEKEGVSGTPKPVESAPRKSESGN